MISTLDRSHFDLILAEDVLRIFDISESTLASWVTRGVLPQPIRPGGAKRRRYWRAQDIQAAIDRLAQADQ